VKEHTYTMLTEWAGNNGQGTSSYKAYRRDHWIEADGKPRIPGSSDPAFRGDPTRYNPEEFLVSALSTCHMLFYLHLCAVNGVVVEDYRDEAVGTMRENADGSGEFVKVVLRPKVKISAGDPEKAKSLHEDSHHLCFIARSVNFPVECEPTLL
jgi:organic hydroperoxide reductase OsmC/OhrA